MVDNISSTDLLTTPGSDQALAFDWLVNTDPLQVCPDQILDVEQRYILAVVYFATGGDEWTFCSRPGLPEENPCPTAGNMQRYLSGGDVCDWFQNDCSADLVMTVLRIGTFVVCLSLIHWSRETFIADFLSLLLTDENNLVGTVPDEIISLTGLQEIDLDQNSLAGTIPDEVGNMPNLVSIDVDDNDFTGTIPESIYNSPILVTVDLDTNNLVGTLDTRIGMVSRLDFLQLDNNALSGAIPTEIGSLDLLSFLSVDANAFTGTIPTELGLNAELRKFLSSKPLWMHLSEQSSNTFPFSNNSGLSIAK
jgi:hypothetical protein